MFSAPSGPAWNLFVVLAVVVAAPLISERVRIPGVVVVSGPHGSGAFATDARLGLEVVGTRG